MGQGIGGNPAADNATIEYDSQAKLRIKDGAVTTAKIADDAVDAAKLKDDATTDANRAVTTNHIRDSAVTTAKIADDAVDAAKLKDDATTDANRAVTTNHIRDSAVTEAKIGAAAVAQGKLKTGMGEVSVANGSTEVNNWQAMMYNDSAAPGTTYITWIELDPARTASKGRFTLPGGEYGFYPQVKHTDPPLVMYARQRYVTASGQDHWVFLLVDKITGNILAGYSAPDHPMYGNGGDILEVPHPFIGNDLTGKEIVILDKVDIAALKAQVTKKDSLLMVIHRDYKIDVAQELPYQPLHTGKFIDEQPVLLDTLPSGIVVRGLKNKV